MIRKAFLDVLVSTYHERPHYPTMQETQALETKAMEVSVQSRRKKRSVSKKQSTGKPARGKGLPELID